MDTITDLGVETPRRPLMREGSVVVVAATLLNLGIHAAARALGGSMRLDPPGQEPNHLIPWFDVAWKTALPLALGLVLLALVRRSRRRVTALMITVLIIFVPTSAVPALVAHDTTTGVALLLLHLLPTAGFTVLALRVRPPQPVNSPRAERSASP